MSFNGVENMRPLRLDEAGWDEYDDSSTGGIEADQRNNWMRKPRCDYCNRLNLEPTANCVGCGAPK